MAAILVKVDKNGTKYYEDYTCDKCGGRGGADVWAYTGWTCYKCGGSGRMDKPSRWKEYTPEYEAKLKIRRAKAHEKAVEKMAAEAAEKNKVFFAYNGFNPDGYMFIVLGNTYEIREQLKAAGARYNKYFKCWTFDHEVAEYNTLKVHADDAYAKNEGGAYMYQWPNIDVVMGMIYDANHPKTESHSEYVGTVGGKVEVECTLTKVSYYDTSFNYHRITVWIYIFTDDKGNVFVWKSQAYIDDAIQAGDRVKVKGTVKDHSEYDGTKQTVLTRCKIEKEAA